MTILLDTCALLWYTLQPDGLSPKAQKAIAEADGIVVCAVSVWEIGIKTVRGKLDLGTSFDDYVERLSRVSDFTIEPVDHRTWARSVMLDWAHRDPADRLIVAMAEQLDAAIISDDEVIKSFYPRTVF